MASHLHSDLIQSAFVFLVFAEDPNFILGTFEQPLTTRARAQCSIKACLDSFCQLNLLLILSQCAQTSMRFEPWATK